MRISDWSSDVCSSDLVMDWRTVFLVLAGVTVAVSLAIHLAVPERAAHGVDRGTLREQIAGFRVVFADRLFWRVAPLTVSPMAANMAIQGHWAETGRAWCRERVCTYV